MATKRDIRAILRELLPEWSEYRPSDRDDAATDERNKKHGRRVQLPLMTDPPGLFSGTLFTNPSVQPAPVSIVRVDGLDQEETTTVYFAWDLDAPNSVPAIPIVMMLFKWGVGGQTFQRMIDAHRVPRRFAVAANFIEVVGMYTDLGAGVPFVDAVVGIASGEADPNYWTSLWMPVVSPVSSATIATQPAAISAIAGTLTALPGGMTTAYLLAIDSATLPTSGVSVPIPGGTSPQLTVGSSFAFAEDEWPGVFADFGVSWAFSTSPNIFLTPGVGTAGFVSVKLGF